MTELNFRASRIPQHRSVRMVHFEPWRLVFWSLFSLGFSLLASLFALRWTGWYADIIDGLLRWANVPCSRSYAEGFWLSSAPAWSVATYNPAALPVGAAFHALAGGALLASGMRFRKCPFPLRAWMGLVGSLLLITTLVLFLIPVPRLSPEAFSRLWSQVSLGTLFLLPWVWGLLVGLFPLPLGRVFLWGFAGIGIVFLWSACRLAFFLALAAWAGVVWLPPAFILGCTLPDILVLVTAYGYALESAGSHWGSGQ